MKRTQKTIIGFILVVLIIALSFGSVFAEGATYPLLQYGSRGTAVTTMQAALIHQGYLSGSADGVYGSMTKNSVAKFQASKKLLIDGIAGNETQTALYAQTATISRGDTANDSDTLYWLARIIHAEAQGECYEGKVAVGNVILNRVNSSDFPNTVTGVIFEYYQGIPQFSPVANGTIYNTPSADSIKAAKEALAGKNFVGKATYFFNPAKSAGKWIVQNKTFVKRIENHVFYQ
jgi:N-acetylmuramoyl-L-alanine amidase